jgi:hypothetical protein
MNEKIGNGPNCATHMQAIIGRVKYIYFKFMLCCMFYPSTIDAAEPFPMGYQFLNNAVGGDSLVVHNIFV